MPVLVLILLSVFLGAGAQVLFKVGVLQLDSLKFNIPGITGLLFSPYILGGLVAFAASFLLWLKVLAEVPLSYAYPMVSLGYVFVFLLSWLYLGESLPALRVVGLALIIGGILLIARS
ncbi:Drug/metabolite transporter [Moorella glycerini]|uniref:4-amino-4-deoxy-L-arabinose-phosphoundecaprenol flippase subunit ArnF n=1 Tax=Neomoorella stamsii TaxID=1266720 RepID=A0A9X7J2F0_9FIRM|nr:MULTISPECIES: SMR family transporter [Moorella]PRR71308.1 4-amino-4-deoxy-L-arabinose-phosphoundecaprenol flippase subunit ArnF [Moorella stamsii]CEP66651.1 Drug/metabolite transporter [Moorella glycerini]